MMQFYFLSIILGIVAGLILINYSQKAEEKELQDPKKAQKLIGELSEKISENEILNNRTFRIVVGILALLTGIIKFFVVAKGGILILGDFIPAVCGIAVGFTILLNFYLENTSIETNLPSVLQLIFVKNAYLLGLVSLAVSALHFLFPGALFL